MHSKRARLPVATRKLSAHPKRRRGPPSSLCSSPGQPGEQASRPSLRAVMLNEICAPRAVHAACLPSPIRRDLIRPFPVGPLLGLPSLRSSRLDITTYVHLGGALPCHSGGRASGGTPPPPNVVLIRTDALRERLQEGAALRAAPLPHGQLRIATLWVIGTRRLVPSSLRDRDGRAKRPGRGGRLRDARSTRRKENDEVVRDACRPPRKARSRDSVRSVRCRLRDSGRKPLRDQDVVPRTTDAPSEHRPAQHDGRSFGGSLLGPELRSNFLPGNDVLRVIAVLLAPSSQLRSMRLRHRKLLAFRGDRIPDVLDQLDPLGERESTNLIEK